MTAVPEPRMSTPEYLAFEARSGDKHEFVNGVVIAMAGAEPAHNLVRERLSIGLGVALAGRRCFQASSDQRVLVEETNFYCYPDLVVTCDPPVFHQAKPRSLLNPNVVFEVLSPSTEAYDRGAKFAQYRRCGSLREYVLVSPGDRRVEHFQRGHDDRWMLTIYDGASILELPTLEATIPLDEIFAHLDLLDAP